MEMEANWEILFIIIPMIFLAGFVDSIAGGGGIISMSGFMLTGLPMHYIIGTNKTQGMFGTAVAMINYVRKGCFDKRFILFSIIGGLIGASLGSTLALALTDDVLRIVATIVLPLMAIFIVSGKRPKRKIASESRLSIYIASFLVGIIVAFYDGTIGPGSGTLFIIGFSMCGLSLIQANGNAKIVNVAANIASVTMFISTGNVVLWLVIPCIITNMVASYFGSKLAIKNGDKIVRPVMLVVVSMLFIKTILDFIL